MKKILHIITGLGPGGAERMLLRIAAASNAGQPGAGAYDHTVISLTDEGVYGAALRDAGADVHCLGMRPTRPDVRAIFKLAALIRRQKPDVVMTWLYHADFIGTLAVVLSGVGMKRLVWNLRGGSIDLAHYSHATRLVIWLLAKMSRFPAAVAPNSKSGQHSHQQLGYRPKRWVYVPNGFDTKDWCPVEADRQQVRNELGADNDQTFVVGLVARADPMKDHQTFFAAALGALRQNRNFRFVLIGQGTRRLDVPKNLADVTTALGERNDLQRLMRGLDLLVLSSVSEGFPNVIGEAMATAVPCVVTAVGDSAEIVGDSGIVVAPRSPDTMAQAMLTILNEPADQRQSRGQRARERIIGQYSLKSSMKIFVDLWDTVGTDTNT